MGRSDFKVEAIERIDELIVGPMLAELPSFGEWALLLMPDHATPSILKTHSNEAVPFALLKGGKPALKGAESTRRYTEAEGGRTGLVLKQGYRLIESLFGKELASN